jgi:hypothetical protein
MYVIDYKKIGNTMWYIGHCISIFSLLPSLIDPKEKYIIVISFTIAAIGQLITMLSRYIERYSKKSTIEDVNVNKRNKGYKCSDDYKIDIIDSNESNKQKEIKSQ